MSIVPLSPWLAHRPRRGAIAVDTAVLHSREHHDIEDLIRELRSNDHSFHYLIERDGTICKGVPFSAVAFHCGNSYGPHEAARGVSCERDGCGAFVDHPCVNEYTLGICLLNDAAGGEPYSKAQFAACVALLRDLKTPLPKLTHVTTHAIVAPGRSSDPAGLDVIELARQAELKLWTPDFAMA